MQTSCIFTYSHVEDAGSYTSEINFSRSFITSSIPSRYHYHYPILYKYTVLFLLSRCMDGVWTCEENECAGMCRAYGDSHYTTFDGKNYQFHGLNVFTLIRSTHESEHKFQVGFELNYFGLKLLWDKNCRKSYNRNRYKSWFVSDNDHWIHAIILK